jgi:hypothetical protein
MLTNGSEERKEKSLIYAGILICRLVSVGDVPDNKE